MTDEQSREAIMRQGARENLENRLNQGLVGASRVLNPQESFNYGQLGVQSAQVTYDNLVNGKEIGELRNKEYQKRVKEGKSLGIHGEPSYPTNYELTAKRAIILEQSKPILPLGELAEIVYSVADGFEFNLPKELQDYVGGELMFKISEKEGLTETEKDALKVYQLLSEAYDLGISLRASRANYFESLNHAGRQMTERYQASEPKNSGDEE